MFNFSWSSVAGTALPRVHTSSNQEFSQTVQTPHAHGCRGWIWAGAKNRSLVRRAQGQTFAQKTNPEQRCTILMFGGYPVFASIFWTSHTHISGVDLHRSDDRIESHGLSERHLHINTWLLYEEVRAGFFRVYITATAMFHLCHSACFHQKYVDSICCVRVPFKGASWESDYKSTSLHMCYSHY